MKYLATIKDVKYFHFHENYLTILDNKIDVYDLNNLLLLKTYQMSVWYSTIIDGKVFFQNENGKSIKIIDIEGNNLFCIEGKYYLWTHILYDNQLHIRAKVNEDKMNLIIKLDDYKILEAPYNLYPSKIISKATYVYESQFLTLHTLSDGSELWRLDVSEMGAYYEEYYLNDVKHLGERKVGEIKGDILVYENVVIFSISNNQLLGVDAETGKILWKRENIYKYSKQLYQNKVYSLSDADFYIIDALTGTLDLSVNLSDEIEKHGLCPYTGKYCISEDYIYFISHHAVGIGALNLQTYQMDWVYFFETEDKLFPYSLQSIQYHQNRLYVLDSESTLHIFEREA